MVHKAVQDLNIKLAVALEQPVMTTEAHNTWKYLSGFGDVAEVFKQDMFNKWK